MSKFLKATSLLLVSFLALSIGGTTGIANASSMISNDANTEVVYVNNMSTLSSQADVQVKSAKKQKTNKDNSIKFSNIKIDKSDINLKGHIKVENQNIPIDLEGKLKRIDTSNKIIVGDLKDTTNRFEVIHFSIDNGSDKMIPAVEDNYDNKNSLNIYLKELNTNNIIFIQTAIPKSIDIKTLFNNVNSLDMFEGKNLFWYTKVVKPEEINEGETKSINGPMLRAANGTTNKAQKNYVIKYTWASKSYGEFIWVECSLLSGNLGYTISKVEKFGCYTWNYTDNKKLSNETTSDIREVNVKSGLESKTGGAYTSLFVGGDFTSGHHALTATISVSASTPIPGVGISFGYTSPQKITVYPKVIDKPSYQAAMDPKYYMIDNGESLNVQAFYRNSASGSVVTTFEYRIYTDLDYTRRVDSITLTNNIY